MIYVSENKSILCKGDFRPARFYKGKKKIAGYETISFEGEGTISLENCYNDRLHNAKIYGSTENVGDLVTEGEHAGKYRIGVVARGKNLFGYIKATIQNGTIIEEFPTGAIVEGNISTTSDANAWSRGWFCPGETYQSAVYPVLHTGDIVTVSADVTLLELREGESYKPNIYLFTRGTGNGYTPTTNIPVMVGETKRISRIFTITEKYDGQAFYPGFTLNSNVVKIENIQIEYSSEATEYEAYKESQTFDIYLEEPLRSKSEYIDFENGTVVRGNAAEEINLPILPTTKGVTVYEINTQIPAKISGEYKKMEE